MSEDAPKKVGRPTVMTPEVKADILGALRVCGSRKAAHNGAGVSKDAFYACLKKDPEFKEAVLMAEAESEKYAMGNIRAQMEGDWRAAAWWLEKRRSQDYGGNQEVRELRKDMEAQARVVAELHTKKANGDGRT